MCIRDRIMAPDPVDPEILAGLARNAPLTRPRPGHADLAGMRKYGFDDARPVLERASARETATRAAVSRAEARSSTGRASSKPYLRIPARSAWPGRGRVSGALRARSSFS